jgi:hypothetical protein
MLSFQELSKSWLAYPVKAWLKSTPPGYNVQGEVYVWKLQLENGTGAFNS